MAPTESLDLGDRIHTPEITEENTIQSDAANQNRRNNGPPFVNDEASCRSDKQKRNLYAAGKWSRAAHSELVECELDFQPTYPYEPE